MADLSHLFGSDLSIGPSGSLLTVTDLQRSQQRILRRLLTNPGAYLWHPTYGAGLASFIGQPSTAVQIQGIIQQQMLLEDSVAQSPPPVCSVIFNPDGTFFASISYVDAANGVPLLLEFDVNQ